MLRESTLGSQSFWRPQAPGQGYRPGNSTDTKTWLTTVFHNKHIDSFLCYSATTTWSMPIIALAPGSACIHVKVLQLFLWSCTCECSFLTHTNWFLYLYLCNGSTNISHTENDDLRISKAMFRLSAKISKQYKIALV